MGSAAAGDICIGDLQRLDEISALWEKRAASLGCGIEFWCENMIFGFDVLFGWIALFPFALLSYKDDNNDGRHTIYIRVRALARGLT